MKRFYFVIIISIVILLINDGAFSKEIEIGGDSPDAIKTIKVGIEAAKSGDTLRLLPGTYNEEIIIDKNLKLIGSDPKRTIIDSTNDGLAFLRPGYSVTILGLTFKAAKYGININKAETDAVIKNCIFTHCKNAIYFSDTSDIGLDNVKISIENNTIVYCSGTAIYINGQYSKEEIIKIKGNIVAFNNGYGMFFNRIESPNMTHNNVYSNTNYNYYGYNEGGDSLSKDPLFVDEEGGNYVLLHNSPCKDKGPVGLESYTDPDGSPNDMGAYGGQASAPFWPYGGKGGGPVITDLHVTPISVPKGHKITIKAKGTVQ